MRNPACDQRPPGRVVARPRKLTTCRRFFSVSRHGVGASSRLAFKAGKLFLDQRQSVDLPADLTAEPWRQGMTATSAATIAAKRLLARSVAESVAAGKAGRNSETPRMSVGFWLQDAMSPRDAVSCSFDCFNIDLKEYPDDPVSVIDVRWMNRPFMQLWS